MFLRDSFVERLFTKNNGQNSLPIMAKYYFGVLTVFFNLSDSAESG